jgi:hypothetical protein
MSLKSLLRSLRSLLACASEQMPKEVLDDSDIAALHIIFIEKERR